jgi:hypothetical protein
VRPPALLIKIAIIIFWTRSLGWAEEPQDTLITLDPFSFYQIEPSYPLIDENKFASILRPSALFSVAENAVKAEYIERRTGAEQLKSLWENEERWALLKTSTSQLADGRSLDAGYNFFLYRRMALENNNVTFFRLGSKAHGEILTMRPSTALLRNGFGIWTNHNLQIWSCGHNKNLGCLV